MAKNENFLKAFDDARATFRTEWMALEESRSILHQPYEIGRAQLGEENLKIQQGAYAQTVGSHDRINQMPQQINTLESHKNQLRDENNKMQAQIHQMEAWFVQIEKQTALPAQRGATEGENDYLPPDVHTVTHTATMGGDAERPFNALGAQPQVGLRGILELRNKFVENGFQPEENIRAFESALGYLWVVSTEQLLAAYRGFFSLFMKPGFDLGQA
ncbi:hypothetical protein DQ04_08501010 [Trypanosoma grayi]|uniref:hypothetical protein n=1 Tax=Trypanosoma grayi TaxID=71804 RepID=UPI0004F46BD0|nr:hypothetical protein DQ04_08501010 [Trypanosoma grayi]KEG07907.1 hypothetical protein DQ04_08501010 [Trypanosoma grayi]